MLSTEANTRPRSEPGTWETILGKRLIPSTQTRAVKMEGGKAAEVNEWNSLYCDFSRNRPNAFMNPAIMGGLMWEPLKTSQLSSQYRPILVPILK